MYGSDRPLEWLFCGLPVWRAGSDRSQAWWELWAEQASPWLGSPGAGSLAPPLFSSLSPSLLPSFRPPAPPVLDAASVSKCSSAWLTEPTFEYKLEDFLTINPGFDLSAPLNDICLLKEHIYRRLWWKLGLYQTSKRQHLCFIDLQLVNGWFTAELLMSLLIYSCSFGPNLSKTEFVDSDKEMAEEMSNYHFHLLLLLFFLFLLFLLGFGCDGENSRGYLPCGRRAEMFWC